MSVLSDQEIVEEFIAKLNDKMFPCLAAHHAAAGNQVRCFVAHHMACPNDDEAIITFMYDFVDEIRSVNEGFYSAVIIFKGPGVTDENTFENLFWNRLQAISDIDAKHYPYDCRVAADPASPHFSFSLKSEAFYVIGIHPASSRKARRFRLPAMVFNAHVQFERLREENHYAKMQQVVRKRDIAFSGSVNPMLADFGEASEAFQYSGKQYTKDWKCPLIIRHATIQDDPAT